MSAPAPEDKKLMAPRRIAAILDEGSVNYISGQQDGNGAVSASGTINGREAIVFSNDPSYQGGSLGALEGKVITDAYAIAMEKQCPIIGIWHSGGARLQEGMSSLNAFGEIFSAMTHA